MLVLGKVTSLNSFPIMLQKYSGFCWAESHWIRYYCSLPFPPPHFFFPHFDICPVTSEQLFSVQIPALIIPAYCHSQLVDYGTSPLS